MGNVSCVADFFRGLSRGVGVQSGNSILFLSPPAFSDLPDLSVQPSFTFSCVNHLIFRYRIPVQYNTKLLLQFQVSPSWAPKAMVRYLFWVPGVDLVTGQPSGSFQVKSETAL